MEEERRGRVGDEVEGRGDVILTGFWSLALLIGQTLDTVALKVGFALLCLPAVEGTPRNLQLCLVLSRKQSTAIFERNEG